MGGSPPTAQRTRDQEQGDMQNPETKHGVKASQQQDLGRRPPSLPRPHPSN